MAETILKRTSSFSEGESINPKILEAEFDRVVRYINNNVERKTTTTTITEDGIKKPTTVISGSDLTYKIESKVNDSLLKVSTKVASEVGTTETNYYQPTSISKVLTYENIGTAIDGGTIPSGYTITRMYWRVIEAFNVNTEIKTTDKSENVLSENMIDLSNIGIGDRLMDDKYTGDNSIVHLLTGASTTGKVRISFLLEKRKEV